MRTEYEIRMDFNRAMAQVERLNGIANSLKALADEDLNASLTNIRSNWEGENAEAFLEKGQKAKQKVSTTASKITRVAATIKSIAERTMQAELAAIRIAED